MPTILFYTVDVDAKFIHSGKQLTFGKCTKVLLKNKSSLIKTGFEENIHFSTHL